MHHAFVPVLAMLAALALAQPVTADEPAAPDAAAETATAADTAAATDAAADAAATPATAPAQPPRAQAAKAEFVPPPGWRAKKRGKFTVYCQKSAEVGTRFATETCYDETGIREMLAKQRDDREKVDQMRRICGSQEACGSR